MDNDQKYLLYTSRQEAEKAIMSLKGILLGITIDGKVDANEISELKSWVRVHGELINRNPFREFIIYINMLLSGVDIPAKEIIEDLYWLCQKYEPEDYFYCVITNDLQELQGICHGILSNGEVNEAEIYGLRDWLSKRTHLSNYYPYDEINTLILDIVSDGKIDESEKLKLKAFFNEFIDLKNDEIRKKVDNEIKDISVSGICSTDVNVIFENKSFCITGVLQRSSRKDLQKDIISLGGLISDSVNSKTDYLIVGDNGNQAWVFACYGRKVEKAVSLRKKGHHIKILHEYDFGDVVDDLK